ncbi:MAG: hypothetical protein JW716_05880 [Candidatus Aenigmarchaeota archaeon]|nr:hypothetical protein [Candidatus Aenigmarchaeota archaeon]
MKNIETIKGFEKKIQDDVEKTRAECEKKLREALASKGEITKFIIDKAQKEADSLIEQAKREAEKETKNVIREAEKETMNIESSASKNMDRAVGMVVSEFKD